MRRANRLAQCALGLCATLLMGLELPATTTPATPPEGESPALTLIVLDPLAKELACACVQGYGQRDYRKLAARLEAVLKETVGIEFSDDLAESLKWAGPRQGIIVVGDRSLVAPGEPVAGFRFRPVCALSGMDGSSSLPGLFVAQSRDPAKELKDISGRALLLGLPESDARYTAALAALRQAGVQPPPIPQKRGSYSEAALDVLDSESDPLPIALVPAYALRLLEGCGSVTPGDLRVIGKTEFVPFITVFLSDAIEPDKQRKIVDSLLELKGDPAMLKIMESRDGFLPVTIAGTAEPRPDSGTDWPDWRGPSRDGRVRTLPARLPETAKVIWKKASMNGGLAGLSISGERLILAERDFADEHDVYRCLHAGTGELLWRMEFPARGQLDYGQSPRATPVIHDGRAYLLGAFGDLRCVEVTDGKVLWQRHLPREFDAELPTWGMCATPLIVDDLLIVNPGGPDASLVALDLVTGCTRWATPGDPAAYSAFIYGEFGGRRQIVGYDRHSLGGWDPKTGERLWKLVPPAAGDFNVPTPIAVEGGLVVSTENNGTRFYRFDAAGRIDPKPVGHFAELAPDTATPVATGGRIFGSHRGLSSLDLRNGLRPIWNHEDNALDDYATLIADPQRVLVVTLAGELILFDARADWCAILSRLKIFEDDVEVYAHPALVGTRLYVRGGYSVMCVDLATD